MTSSVTDPADDLTQTSPAARSPQSLERAQRQARLLEAGARVSRRITSILDLEALLAATVDAICDEFGFYYAGIFLLDEAGPQGGSGGSWAVLRAGRGEAGAALVAAGHKIKVGGDSLVGIVLTQRRALIAPDGGEEAARLTNSRLPEARSEMALPLLVGDRIIGALSVQSTEEAAFGDDDITALQIVADQLAIAIGNARLLADLERTHRELVRTKTYEAIANATGEAIHWVGNRAAPVPGSVARIREDVIRYLALTAALLEQLPPELREQKSARLLAQAMEQMAGLGIDLWQVRAELDAQSFERLSRTLSVESIFEDLSIIEAGARAILDIKEDFIGPARQQKEEIILLPDLLQETVTALAVPKEYVRTLFAADLPPVKADRVQLGRVFINLIKNAMEAMEGVEDKRLFLWARRADDPGFVVVDVIDNGIGVPPDQIDKIWMAFYTTKSNRGGTGLGLPACAQIVSQLGGRITVESEPGQGSTFSVFLPAANLDS